MFAHGVIWQLFSDHGLCQGMARSLPILLNLGMSKCCIRNRNSIRWRWGNATITVKGRDNSGRLKMSCINSCLVNCGEGDSWWGDGIEFRVQLLRVAGDNFNDFGPRSLWIKQWPWRDKIWLAIFSGGFMASRSFPPVNILQREAAAGKECSFAFVPELTW